MLAGTPMVNAVWLAFHASASPKSSRSIEDCLNNDIDQWILVLHTYQESVPSFDNNTWYPWHRCIKVDSIYLPCLTGDLHLIFVPCLNRSQHWSWRCFNIQKGKTIMCNGGRDNSRASVSHGRREASVDSASCLRPVTYRTTYLGNHYDWRIILRYAGISQSHSIVYPCGFVFFDSWRAWLL